MGKYKELIVDSFYDNEIRVYKAKRNRSLVLWFVFLIGLVVFFLR